MLEELSHMTALRVFVVWKGRAVIQGVVLLNKRLNLPFQWHVKSLFYATEYKDYQTRLHATSLQSLMHTCNEARGNPHNNMGKSPSNGRARANEPEEDNARPALHLTPTCLP